MVDAPYSLDHLIEVSGNDTEFIVEILEMFLPQAIQEVDLIEELIVENQWEKAKFVIHRLRSSSGSVGAMKIARRCSEFEQFLANSDDVQHEVGGYRDAFLAAARTEIAEIEAELKRLKDHSGE